MMYQNTNTQVAEAARLEDYIKAVQQRKWLVLALTALGLLGSLLFLGTRTATYTATAEVLLRPTPVGSTTTNLVAPNLIREAKVLASNQVADRIIADNNLSTPAGVLLAPLDVDFEPSSDVLQVSYTTTNAEDSATWATAFASAYVNIRESEALSFYDTRIASNTTVINDAQVSLDEARDEVTKLQRELQNEEAGSAQAIQLTANIAKIQIDISDLNVTVRNTRAARRGLEDTKNSRSPSGELLREASVPRFAEGIGQTLMMIGGTLLGLMIGVVVAFLLERLDTTARDEEDVALALGTTVMGSIPTLGIGFRGGSSSLIMLSAGGSARIAAAREAFRRLRSSIQFLNTSSGVSSIIVTSSAPSEGKSLTSSNLSIALSQNGARVVLVSADLRRPTLEKLFGMEANRPGLSEYLSNVAELNAEKVPGIDNLWLIRSGAPPDNPGELLNSDRFEQMIKELEREDVEYIVVDTPPVLSTADAVSAARYVDGVLVVVDTERTETTDLLQVRADLERSGSKLLGAVMNRQTFSRGGLFKRNKYAYYRADARRLADRNG